MLLLRGITKRYVTTVALDDVSLDIAPGEVHAVLGENGAGKSTLMKIAFGLVRPDRGVVERGGKVGMVHQHFTCIDSLTVAENIALAADWPVRPSVMNAKARELSERLGLPLEPTLLAGSLSAGLKQRLELLKALSTDAQILLLDEPTSVLAPPEAEALLGLIRALRGRGITIVFITHKLDEALAIADRVTVLRRGIVTLAAPTASLDRAALITAMIGGSADYADSGQQSANLRESVKSADHSARSVELVVLAEELMAKRLGGTGSGLRRASFELRSGEIVGVAAVEGNGQRELFRAIAGLVAPSAGALQVNGRVSFIPEDRTSEGSVQEFTLAENLALVMGDEAPWVRRGWMDWDGAEARIEELTQQFDVRGVSQPRARGRGSATPALSTLSGGNQQKVIVAAALERKPAVLLAENPTRGLDIKASADVLGRLKVAARSGVAVLVHLPDLDELLPLVDRVVVLNQGVLTEMPVGAERQAIGAVMVSGAGSGE
jgi:simple sugar transport system ATP-binding protein